MKLINRIKILIKHPSLLKELVVSFSIVSFIVFALGYSFYYNSTFNILRKYQESETIQQFKQLDRNFNSFFDKINKFSAILLKDLSSTGSYQYQDQISQLMEINTFSDENAIGLLNGIGRYFKQFIGNFSYINSIYIYTGKGGIIGCTNMYTKTQIEGEKKEYIYQSGIFDHTVKDYPELIWYGGNSLEDIGCMESKSLTENEVGPKMLSAVRSFKSIYSDGKKGANGILIINIHENELTDYYKYLFDFSESNAYIADTSGRIISGVDKTLLGKKSVLYNRISSKENYGSFLWDDSKIEKNVFYYKIKYTGWTLFYEVPLSKYKNDITEMKLVTVKIFIFYVFFVLIISFIIFKRITKPLDSLTMAMASLGKGTLGLTIKSSFKNEFGLLAKKFNQMSLDILELMEEKEKIAKEKRRHEIAALQAQINPHFILNTMNTIKWMAIIANATNIVNSISMFGNLLKPLLKMQSDYYVIKEEIEYLNNYVNILNYRYGNIIKLFVDIPHELYDCKIPRFILQPIVENAVQHGMDKTYQEFIIQITAFITGEDIRIEISNNGVGISREELDKIRQSLSSARNIDFNNTRQIGLNNIEKRLKLYYGEGYGIMVDSIRNQNTTVSVTIPIQK